MSDKNPTNTDRTTKVGPPTDRTARRTFIVRVWREPRKLASQLTVWRGSVVQVADKGERISRAFSSPGTLLAYLAKKLNGLCKPDYEGR